MTVAERFAEVSGDEQQAEIGFVVTGHNTWADAYNELKSETSGAGQFSSFNGIPAQRRRLTEINESKGYFNASVTYSFDPAFKPGKQTPTKPNGMNSIDVFSFETTVSNKLERWKSDGPGWTVIDQDLGGGIMSPTVPGDIPDGGGSKYKIIDRDGLGWGGDEKGYEGIEVPRPSTSFYLEYVPAATGVTTTYLTFLSDSVGKVNDASFNIGYPAGEVLLAGIRGQGRSEESWRFTFQFLQKPNRTNVFCGNGITIASVLGWDIIEVEYARYVQTIPAVPTVEPAPAPVITEVARQARVLRPFEQMDFDLLFP